MQSCAFQGAVRFAQVRASTPRSSPIMPAIVRDCDPRAVIICIGTAIIAVAVNAGAITVPLAGDAAVDVVVCTNVERR
jgi:small ligand-binding sensory domain FIST